MTILLIFITNLSACTITTKRRRIYDVTLAHIVTSLNILKSYEDKRNKNETKSYFYKVSSILKYYVTKVIIIILNFLFEQDRYGCLHEKYLSF